MLRLLFPTFYCSSAVPVCIFKEEYSNNHINWPCKVRYSEKVPMWIRWIKISVCVYDQFKSDVFLRMQSEIFQDYPGRGGKPGILSFFFSLCLYSSALDHSATAPSLLFCWTWPRLIFCFCFCVCLCCLFNRCSSAWKHAQTYLARNSKVGFLIAADFFQCRQSFCSSKWK